MKMIKIYGALLAGALTLGAQAQQQQQQPAENNNANSSRNLPPGLERRDQLPPGLNKRENLPPGLQNWQQSSSDVQGEVAEGALVGVVQVREIGPRIVLARVERAARSAHGAAGGDRRSAGLHEIR